MRELKRVSFKVAMLIKEVGYPQGETDKVYVVKDKRLPLYGNRIEEGSLIDSEFRDFSLCIDAPYTMQVWLWLWREKGIYIDIAHYYSSDEATIWDKKYNKIKSIDCFGKYQDPEEAIIAAIEYLVTNDLIK